MSKQAEATRSRARKEAEQRRRVLEIAKGLSATLGSDFFHSVVSQLAATFQADCVFLGEVAGTPPDRIRTLAVSGPKVSENFEQRISGTASGQVLGNGLFACSKGVRRLFPSDDWVEALDAEGFIGIRLSDSAGQPAGLLAMVSQDGFTNIEVIKPVLETFVPRAAAELERKRSDDVHRENEERYHAFISANPDAMWRIEMEQPVPLSLSEEEQIDRICRFGYLAECNNALAQLAGVESTEELVGSRFGEITARITWAREELRSAIRSGFRTMTVEATPNDSAWAYRLRTQFGIVENGALRRIWGTTRDITTLRRTELSLAASERRFREVLEGIQLPAVMLDLHGAIEFANECFLRLAQRSIQEISTLTWLNGVIPDGETETWKAAIVPDERGRHAGFHFVGSIISPDARPRVIAWDTISLSNQDNELAGLAAIGRDITHQTALETEILEVQKLESIGRLAAGVAHDFNNLLTVVLGHTMLLLEQIPESDSVHERLSEIQTAATQCIRLTGELLAFGRKQYLRPTLISLNDVISSHEGIIRSMIGEGIELTIDLASEVGLVHADPTQLQRALDNLVTNARDAMPQGGNLIIGTSNVAISADDAMYPGIEGGLYARLSVSDSGVGLTKEIREHIFEPFFTTKEQGKGTGLGLPTVHGIVAQSGGHIGVHSEPGKGTCFEILLPIARD